MPYVFYDTETTGTSIRFDQVLQFAAIKTDDDLNEVDRFEIRSRLLPHIIPSPGALKVTRVRMSDLLSESRPTHFEMTCELRRKLIQWGASKFIGWNNMSFDEEMLRQAFYQSLLPPYLTNTNGNGRVDLLKIAQLASTVAPNAIAIPRSENGRATYKLDRVAPLNGFDHGNAHDAMADVEATLYLARVLKTRAPDLWDSSVRFAQKSNVKQFLETHEVFLLGESYYNRPYRFVLTLIGSDPDNANCAIGADPTFPWDRLRGHSDEALRDRMLQSPKPLRRIKINAAPSLLPLSYSAAGVAHAGEDVVELARSLRSDQHFCRRLVAAARRPTPDPSPYLEEQIYDRFPSAADEQRMRDFHRGQWEERARIVQDFEDPRLIQIGRRLIYLHRPELLDSSSRSAEALAILERLTAKGAASNRWMVIDRAEEEIRSLLSDCTDEETHLMNELADYLSDCRTNALGMASTGT